MPAPGCSERTDLVAWVSVSAPWCFLFCEREVVTAGAGARVLDAVGPGPHASALAAAERALAGAGWERVPFSSAAAYLPGRAPTVPGAAGASAFNLLFDASSDPAAIPRMETGEGTPDDAPMPHGRPSGLDSREEWRPSPGLF